MNHTLATSAPARAALLLALATAAGGCVEKAQFVQGHDLSTLLFRPTSSTEGVFPDVSVLTDPQNPFANIAYRSIDAVNNPNPLQFQLNNAGPPVARFYIWATILARAAPEGDGQAQFFTAQGLQETLYQQQVPFDGEGNPSADALRRAREMAIAGFSEVLTQFPNTTIYDVTGTQQYELDTQALQAILALGGLPPTGWILVTDSMGLPRAVKQ